MPTRRFILTRHSGAAAWIKSRIQIDQQLSHVDDLSVFNPGDEVYGVFPVHLAASLCAMGVRCFHIEFDVPEALRGKEITETGMDTLNARLNEYFVIRAGEREDKPPPSKHFVVQKLIDNHE